MGPGGCYEEQVAGREGGQRRCCHHPTAHNSAWPEGDRCLAALKLPKALPISWTSVHPMLLTALSQRLQTCHGRKPCLEDDQSHHWWLSLGGS